MAHLSVKELKGDLIAAGVDLSSYVEKSELVHIWEQRCGTELTVPQAATEDVPSAEPTVAVAVAAPRRSRQFWHAGEYKSHTASSSSSELPEELDRARVHPKFLHSNATSHKWALGAVAELLDNSVDEIPNGCTFVAVDIESDGEGGHMMSVLDDGSGMDRTRLHNMLSFGMSNGSRLAAQRIGQYGNGFKTSSMRLGGNALVLTKCPSGACAAGLLSYTMLRATGAEDVVVPLVSWDDSGALQLADSEATRRSLDLLLEWSPYRSEARLRSAFDRLGAHGTLILVGHLWENESGRPELDWESDPTDVRLHPAEGQAAAPGRRKGTGASREQQQAIRDKYYGWQVSLRKYTSVLYKKLPPSFEIRLRGVRLDLWDVAAELQHTQVERYAPQLPPHTQGLAGVYPITLGFVVEAPDAAVMGFLVYHRNRLIKCMWEPYSSPSSTGRGVIGVLEVDFVQPAHDKQDFERTDLFGRLESKLKQLQPAFWRAEAAKVGYAVNQKKQRAPEPEPLRITAARGAESPIPDNGDVEPAAVVDLVNVGRPAASQRNALSGWGRSAELAPRRHRVESEVHSEAVAMRETQAAMRKPKRQRTSHMGAHIAHADGTTECMDSTTTQEHEGNRIEADEPVSEVEVVELEADYNVAEERAPERPTTGGDRNVAALRSRVKELEQLLNAHRANDQRANALQARVGELELLLRGQAAELTSLRAYKASTAVLLQQWGVVNQHLPPAGAPSYDSHGGDGGYQGDHDHHGQWADNASYMYTAPSALPSASASRVEPIIEEVD